MLAVWKDPVASAPQDKVSEGHFLTLLTVLLFAWASTLARS